MAYLSVDLSKRISGVSTSFHLFFWDVTFVLWVNSSSRLEINFLSYSKGYSSILFSLMNSNCLGSNN